MSAPLHAFLAAMCIFGGTGSLLTICHVAVLWSEGEL